MNEINRTMYIPLYAKAEISRKGIILDDKMAEEIWSKEGFSLGKRSRSKWLSYFMAMRARVFDDWTRMQCEHMKDAVVLHIGAGMDSRVLRVGTNNTWYDVDFGEVIAERSKYFNESETYHMLEGDAKKCDFLDAIEDNKDAIIVLEGISMYLTNDELSNLFVAIEAKFHNIAVLMDVYTLHGAKMSKRKNPVKDVGVTTVYGVDSPIIPINNTSIRYIAEHSMTPQNLVDEMHGFDRLFFSTMFTGKIAKKMYRLYEYKLNRKEEK